MKRHPAMRAAVLATLCALTLAACGTTDAAGGDEPAPAESDASAAPEQIEIVGEGMIIQRSATEDVALCIGPMTMIYPPQCTGPRLLGDFAWDDVESQTDQGVQWTGNYVVVGYFDKAANTFTLTRPPSQELPDGVSFPTPPAVDFPQLCEDPFRGGDPDFADPDLAKQEELNAAMQALDGYVGSYVSDGNNLFNVVVTGDPEAAHAALREVWDGGLCVAHQEGPSEADLSAAQEALKDHGRDLDMVSSSINPMSGTLTVHLDVAYPDTVAQIEQLVSEWLTPDQVFIQSTFVPLAQG